MNFSAKVTFVSFVIASVGVALAIQNAWLCDDAFISFRYAQNLTRGLGLVYNAEEKVEGYTNFLWTLILAGGMQLKLYPELLSQTLGVLSYGCILWLLFLFEKRIASDKNFIPIGLFGYALFHHGHIFATSGLETALYTCLAISSFYFFDKEIFGFYRSFAKFSF